MTLLYTNVEDLDRVILPHDNYYIIYGVGSTGHYMGIFATFNNHDKILSSYDELIVVDQDLNKDGNIITELIPREGMTVCENDSIWQLTESEIIKHVLMETI